MIPDVHDTKPRSPAIAAWSNRSSPARACPRGSATWGVHACAELHAELVALSAATRACPCRPGLASSSSRRPTRIAPRPWWRASWPHRLVKGCVQPTARAWVHDLGLAGLVSRPSRSVWRRRRYVGRWLPAGEPRPGRTCRSGTRSSRRGLGAPTIPEGSGPDMAPPRRRGTLRDDAARPAASPAEGPVGRCLTVARSVHCPASRRWI